MKGLELLLKTISRIQRKVNKKLTIRGILITMVDYRTNYAKDITDMVQKTYGNDIYMFENVIPHSVRAAEASALGVSVYVHDPKGTVAAAYDALTWEVMA